MAHLLISLCVLFAYLYTVVKGTPDTTLQNLLLIIGGYWFGAMGKTMLTRSKDNSGKGEPNE